MSEVENSLAKVAAFYDVFDNYLNHTKKISNITWYDYVLRLRESELSSPMQLMRQISVHLTEFDLLKLMANNFQVNSYNYASRVVNLRPKNIWGKNFILRSL
jgi:hypothetical protein